MKKGLLALSLLGTIGLVNAQRTITGTVKDEDGKKLSNVYILDTQSKRWSQTNSEGIFIIELLNDNTNLTFSQKGKETQDVLIDSSQSNINITLYNQSLRLALVEVFPKKKKEYSEITLGKEAIENVQAFSLNEVLQQLPGQVTLDFNNNEFKNVVFRTAISSYNLGLSGSISSSTINDRKDYFQNKAFGTAIVVNDIPMSNNENMQEFTSLAGGDFGNFNNPSYGVDLRQISTANIEEVKIIQGIAPAKYGDLTSGLIIINSKVGATPLRASISMRDATTEYNLSKGFKLNNQNYFSISGNYLHSNSDVRDNLNKYNRFTTNLAWKTNSKDSRITNTLEGSFAFNDDHVKFDPDDISDSRITNKKNSIRLSNNFKYNLQKNWIDALNVDANINYEVQNSKEEKWTNVGVKALTTSTVNGISEAIFLPNQYTAIKNVEGIPVSSFLNIEGVKSYETQSKWNHTISVGLSSRSSSNKGRGTYTDENSIPNFYTLSGASGGLGYRDYNFTNSKTEWQLSAYAEDRIVKYGKNDNVFKLDLGLRYDNQLGYSALQPRVNTSYAFNRVFRVRGGYGIATKTPSLNQLYTGNRYYDRLLGSGIYYIDGKQYGWIETFDVGGNNLNLKPSKSYQSEIGFDINLPFGALNVTGYYNKLTNGISTTNRIVTLNGSNIALDISGDNPAYTVTGSNPFQFSLGTLENNLESVDKGIEMFLNFERIKPLNLDIAINGSYTKTTNNKPIYTYLPSTNVLASEKYAVYYNPISNDEQLMFGTNFNYHLKNVGLVLSLRTEHIFMQNHDKYTNRNPVGYLDINSQYHEIPEADRNNTELYGHLIKAPQHSLASLQKSLHNFHLRLSKDFLNGFKVSVYTTNILGLKPTYINDSGERVESKIAKFSLGGKIEYTF
jgi:ferric enterobactin receptor